MRAACLRAAVAWGVWTSKFDLQSSTIRRLGSDAEPADFGGQPGSNTGAPYCASASIDARAADKCQAAEFEGTPPGIILRSLHSRKQRPSLAAQNKEIANQNLTRTTRLAKSPIAAIVRGQLLSSANRCDRPRSAIFSQPRRRKFALGQTASTGPSQTNDVSYLAIAKRRAPAAL